MIHKHLLLLFILSFPIHNLVLAHNSYRPLVEEGKMWIYHYRNSGGQIISTGIYQMTGDTIVGGHLCKKMYSNEYGQYETANNYKGALYETDKRIFWFMPNSSEPRLLYDYNLNRGDYVIQDWNIQSSGNEMKVFVNAIAYSICDDGRVLKWMYLCPNAYHESGRMEDEGHGSWIEGVGSTNDFYEMISYTSRKSGRTLYECRINEDVLYGPDLVMTPPIEDNYSPFSVDGREWKYVHHYNDNYGSHDDEFSYIIKGDTVINSTLYKKLYKQTPDGLCLSCVINESGRMMVGMRDGSYLNSFRHSFYYFDTDFSDVSVIGGTSGTFVARQLRSIDSVFVNGHIARRLTFHQKSFPIDMLYSVYDIPYGEDVYQDIWVEGIGSYLTGIESPLLAPNLSSNGDYVLFISCLQDGECIFSAGDFLKDKIIDIKQIVNRKSSNKKCFDLTGRRLAAPPTRGLYIEEGKVRVK